MPWEDVRWFVPGCGRPIPNRPDWTLRSLLYENGVQQSQVWMADHPQLGQRVFKFWHDAGGDRASFLDMLKREVALRRALGRDGERLVAPVVDCHLAEPRPGESYAPFIALPYYPEESLSRFLQVANGPSNPASISEAERIRLDLVAQIGELVHALHERGIYHGDIRVANVLLQRDVPFARFTAWLTDLGHAGYLDGRPVITYPDGSEPEAALEGTICSPQDPASIAVDLERSAEGAQALHDVLSEDRESPTRSINDPQVPPSCRVPDLVATDIRQIGILLYQCLLSRFDANADLHGVWQDNIPCPVLRRIIADTQRPGVIRNAKELARRIREVGLSRVRRRLGLVVALAAIFFLSAAVSAGGWWLTAKNERLVQNLRLQEAHVITQEILHSGDIAAIAGAWEEMRSRYRAALQRPDLTDARDKFRLHQKILRASMFLDDMQAVKEELQWLGEQGDLGICTPAVCLDRAVYELELAMRESAVTEGESSPHEAQAVSLLKQVFESRDAEPADRLTALGLHADTYEQAERRFEEALAQDPFHPYATIYLVSTSMLAGRLEKAAAHARVWQMMSRKDPAPLLYEAFLLTLLGKRGEADQVLQRINVTSGIGPTLSSETFAAYRAVMDLAAALQDLLAEALVDPMARINFIGILATKLPSAMGGFAQTGVFRVPLPPAQRQAFQRFLEAIKLGHLPFAAKPAQALADLNRVGSFVPEGLLCFFRGKYYLDLGDKAKAAEAFEQATARPAFFDIRRLCWLTVANYCIGRANQAKGEEAIRLKREARLYLRRAVALGSMTNNFREKVIQLLVASDGLEFAEELASERGDLKTLERIHKLRANSPLTQP